MCLKKNMNAPRPSEHPPVRGKISKRLGGITNNTDVPRGHEQDAGGNMNWASTRHQLPPLWVDKVDSVEEDVRLIQLKSKLVQCTSL